MEEFIVWPYPMPYDEAAAFMMFLYDAMADGISVTELNVMIQNYLEIECNGN